MIKSIEWTNDGVVMLDQRLLPLEEVYLTCQSCQDVAQAIRTMVIRGAPAIGIAASMGIALSASKSIAEGIDELDLEFESMCGTVIATRPTAVNLSHAVERMKSTYQRFRPAGIEAVRRALVEEALDIQAEDHMAGEKIGRLGQELLPANARVLTHCNTGALATAGFGTALGIIKAAVAAGKSISVYAGETRPLLQGARLTAWELAKENIPVTVITDSMAGYFMQNRSIDCVLVGADRIAANGDVANKIGTYSIAVLAKENRIPFYVAAPITTLDLSLHDGGNIPIEQRDPDEVRKINGIAVMPEDASVENPAFDVTPHRYISAIVTDHGVVRHPYDRSLREIFDAGFQTAD